MDYTKFVDGAAPGSVDAMRFDEKLYWVSALVDVLRDNTKELIELTAADTDVSGPARTELIARYTRLRHEASQILADDEATRMLEWTRDLEASAGADEVYEASATLARCLDVVINLPAFVATRVSQRTEIHSVLKRAGAGAEAGTDTGTRSEGGQYL